MLCYLVCVGVSSLNANVTYAETGTGVVYWDPVKGKDAYDGFAQSTPKLKFDDTNGVMSVIGDGSTYGVVKMLGNASVISVDTTLDGSTDGGNISLERDESYNGNLFIVSSGVNLLLKNMFLPSQSSVAISVQNNATLWLDNVSFGTDNQDYISLEGGYVALVGNNNNSYVINSTKTMDGTVLVKSNGVLLNLNSFSLSTNLSADYYLAKNTNGDICIYLKQDEPEEPVFTYSDTVYISDTGVDSNTGATAGQPVRTISKAVEIAQENEEITKLGIAGNVYIIVSTTWNAATFSQEFESIVSAGGSIIVQASFTLDMVMLVPIGTGIKITNSSFKIGSKGSITVTGADAIGVDNVASTSYDINVDASGRLTATNGVAYQISGTNTINNTQLSYITATGSGETIRITNVATVTVTSATTGLTINLGYTNAVNGCVLKCTTDYSGATFIDSLGNDVTSSIKFTIDGLYWIGDSIYVDSLNGGDEYEGRIASAPVYTIARAVSIANTYGLTKICLLNQYSITSAEIIDAEGITIDSNFYGSNAILIGLNGSLTLNAGIINGNVLVNNGGNLDYIGGSITGEINVYGSLTVHNSTPSDSVFNIRASLDNPIIESDDITGTETFYINVFDSMIDHTLVTSGGEADAIYEKADGSTPEISLSANTGTITVSGTFIYVSSTGSNDNTGLSSEEPVATVTKALELLSEHENYAIMLLDTVVISDVQNWSKGALSWTPTIYSSTTSTYMVNVTGSSASLTVDNIIFDGRKQGPSCLIGMTNSAILTIENGTIIQNGSYYGVNATTGKIVMNGGIIRDNKQGVGLYSYSTFTMNGGEISGNVSTANGGGVYVNTSTFVMYGGNIKNNTSSLSGGGVAAINSSTFTMHDGCISNNIVNGTDSYGGGLYAAGSKTITIMNGGSILDNLSTKNGGGVYLSGGATFTMNGGLLSENNADLSKGAGGGVAIYTKSIFIMNDGTISNNSSNYYGGGVYIDTDSTLTMNGGKIINNTSRMGGGLYVIAATSNVFNAYFAGNSATDGGAIFVCNNSKLVIEDSEILNNTASSYGGGLNISSSKINMNNISVVGNFAIYGGGISSTSSTFDINNSRIQENIATTGGGGIHLLSSTIIMQSGSISSNNANDGGGVYIAKTSTFYLECGEIIENTASSSGGGVYVDVSSLGSAYYFVMNGGIIANNTATASGGGIYSGGNRSDIATRYYLNGGVVQNNQARIGGGLYLASYANAEINGGSIIENSATEGGAVYLYGSNKLIMNGGLIENNITSLSTNCSIGMLQNSSSYLKNTIVISSNDEMIKDEILLARYSTIELGVALINSPVVYKIVVPTDYRYPNTTTGNIFVTPNGYAVTDASQYLAHFTAKTDKANDVLLGKISNNIGVVLERYIDGVNGDNSNDGSSPTSALKTLSGTAYAVNYILNTVTIDSDMTISNSISIVRYTGWAVNSRYYPQMNGNLIEIVEGGSLTLSAEVGFSSKRYETDSDFNGHFIAIKGGNLVLNSANAIRTSFDTCGAVYLQKGSYITQGATAYLPVSPLTIALDETFASGDVVVESSTANLYYTLVDTDLGLTNDGANVTISLEKVEFKYYVSSDGSDDNDGTEESPYLTLTKAIASATITGGQIIILDTLTISSNTTLAFLNTFTLEAADGVTDILNITDGEVILTGYVRIISGTIVITGGYITASTSNTEYAIIETPINVVINVESLSTTTAYVNESAQKNYFNVTLEKEGYFGTWNNGSSVQSWDYKAIVVKNYYVDQTLGKDTYNGTSTATAYKTLKKAYTSLSAYGGNIFIIGNYSVNGFNTSEISSTFVTENGTTTYLNSGKIIKIVWYSCSENTNLFTANDYSTLKLTDLEINGNSLASTSNAALICGTKNASIILNGLTVTNYEQKLVEGNTISLNDISAPTVMDASNVSILATNSTANITIYDNVNLGTIDFNGNEGAKIVLASNKLNEIILNLGFRTNGAIVADTSRIGSQLAENYVDKINLLDSNILLKASNNKDEIEIFNIYEISRHKVTFDFNDDVAEELILFVAEGTNVLFYSQTAGEFASLPTITRSGYSFGGWMSEEVTYWDANNKAITSIGSDITLTAKWTANTTAITIVANNGNSDVSIVATYGSQLPSFSAPVAQETYELDGYYLLGMTTKVIDADGGLISSIDGYSDSLSKWAFAGDSLTLVANWSIINYTYIFYDEDGLSELKNAKVTMGSLIEAPENPSKAATAQYTYTFDGWYTAQTGGNKVTSFGNITDDIAYYARYTSEVNKYTYTFYDEDGLSELKTLTVDYGTTITAPEDPSKVATAQYTYTFDGWYTAKTGGNKVTSFGNITDDIAYYARYTSEVNKYTYTFYNEDGLSELKTLTVDYGTTITAPENPSKVATAQYTYTFDGWYSSQTGGIKVTSFGTITGDITYYARYTSEVNKYTYTFYDEDGESKLKTSTVDYGTTITAPEDPSKVATAQYTYTFNGWYTDLTTTPGTKVTSFGTITDDIAYYARYSLVVNAYTYTFYDDDGESKLKTLTVDYGTTITAPENPSKEATAQYTYTFDGWYTDLTTMPGTKVENFETIDRNIYYYARFISTINSYRITWVNDVSVIEIDEMVNYGTMPTFDGAMPRKDETDTIVYEFDGWSPAVITVVGNATYSEVFKEKLKSISTPVINPDIQDEQDRIEGEVSSPEGFDPNTVLVVKVIAVETVDTTLTVPDGKQLVKTYNATLYVNDVVTAPNGEITIKFAKSASLAPADSYTIIIVENGEVVQKRATVDGDYIVFTTSVLGDFAIIDNVEELDQTINLTWVIILLAIINAFEIVAAGILFKSNKNRKKNGTKTYSILLPSLIAASIIPGGQTAAIIILSITAIGLAGIITMQVVKQNKATKLAQQADITTTDNNVNDDVEVEPKKESTSPTINSNKKSVSKSAKDNKAATKKQEDVTTISEELNAILLAAKSTAVVKTELSKKSIADYLETTYGKNVIVNRRENYTSTGLPLADTHYIVINKKNYCFIFVYEFDDGKVFVLLKTSKKVVNSIKKVHSNITPSRFPKSTTEQWYSLIIDDSFDKQNDLFKILSSVVEDAKNKHKMD